MFYETLAKVRKIKVGQKTPEEEILADNPEWTPAAIAEHRTALQKYLAQEAEQIARIIIDAISTKDSEKIFEVAEAVEFLRTFKPAGDSVRSKILFNKIFLQETNQKWTIGQLAKIIDWPKDDRSHGFPQLRRLCKELEFPLAPSRQIGGL